MYKQQTESTPLLSPEQQAQQYLQLANQGDMDAQCRLGVCYENGKGIQQNLELAFECYYKAAQQGHANAQTNLGYCYEIGIGTNNNIEKALEWYTKAEQQKNRRARYLLGRCYYNGTGVNTDPVKAVEYYRLAANQGHSNAQNQLGNCYEFGTGIEKNLTSAFEWYEKAAKQGHPAAQTNLGYCYEYALGVDKNMGAAVGWYTQAAEKGQQRAQYLLGLCYEFGTGIEKNLTSAFECYEKAAKQGHLDAQTKLGYCYENGIGVEKNMETAVKWYTQAADQGHKKAQIQIAGYYQGGYSEIIKSDLKKAIHYNKLAADQGDADSQKNIAYCYEHGYGIESDPKKAIYYYGLAAEQGSINALFALSKFYQQGYDIIPMDMAKAVQYSVEAFISNIYPNDIIKGIITSAAQTPLIGIVELLNLLETKRLLTILKKNPDELALIKDFMTEVAQQLIHEHTTPAESNAVERIQKAISAIDSPMDDSTVVELLPQTTTEAPLTPQQCYDKGLQLETDGKYLEAVDYYFQAFSLFHFSASNKLGLNFNSFSQSPINPDAKSNLTDDMELLFKKGLLLLSPIKNPNPQLGFEYIKAAADKGLAKAQWLMGYLYQIIVQKNPDKAETYNQTALYYHCLAALQHYAPAQHALGHFYKNGIVINVLGNHYRNDSFESLKEIKWYAIAADRGYVPALCGLGSCFANGQGVDQNIQQAVHYWKLAAMHGNNIAQFNLGYSYASGQGVAQNWELALENYHLAAKQGNSGAHYNLGYCYANGQGVAQNWELAITHWLQAADQDHDLAQLNLGLYYLGRFGHPIDQEQAMHYLQQAANLGNDTAQLVLGNCYEDIDIQQAINYYQMAADQSNALAQYNLGKLYKIKGNLVEAEHFYQLAAAQKNPKVLRELHNLYSKDEQKSNQYQIEACLIEHPIDYVETIISSKKINDKPKYFMELLENPKLADYIHQNQQVADLVGSYLFKQATILQFSEGKFDETIALFKAVPTTSIFYLFALDAIALMKYQLDNILESDTLLDISSGPITYLWEVEAWKVKKYNINTKTEIVREVPELAPADIRHIIKIRTDNYFEKKDFGIAFESLPKFQLWPVSEHQKQLLAEQKLYLDGLHKINREILAEMTKNFDQQLNKSNENQNKPAFSFTNDKVTTFATTTTTTTTTTSTTRATSTYSFNPGTG